MQMNTNEFGQYLTELREKAGYDSQAALGKASGVWNSTIARIEDGSTKSPDPITLTKLAPYLKVSVNELMIAAGYLEPTANSGQEIPKPREIPDELLPKMTKIIKKSLGSLTPAEKEFVLEQTKLTIEAIMKLKKEKSE